MYSGQPLYWSLNTSRSKNKSLSVYKVAQFSKLLEDYQITALQLSDNDMVVSDNSISYKSR